jgi:hypothetical protein
MDFEVAVPLGMHASDGYLLNYFSIDPGEVTGCFRSFGSRDYRGYPYVIYGYGICGLVING